jgi:hypothetical protein
MMTRPSLTLESATPTKPFEYALVGVGSQADYSHFWQCGRQAFSG